MSKSTPDPKQDDPAQAFTAAIALRLSADKIEHEAVVAAINQGWSWSRIADAMGISKQAAHKRFRHCIKDR